jgi:6-pyruvoyltetrahydropterin/6-carboxytetrahydropterin synthase
MRRADWSDEEAERRFGAVARHPGHGHLYRVAVTVAGPLDPETGTVVDLVALDDLLAREVVIPLDGSDLNATVAEVVRGDVVPGCEAIAASIWRRLADRLPHGVRLERVTVAEDDTLEAECLGP